MFVTTSPKTIRKTAAPGAGPMASVMEEIHGTFFERKDQKMVTSTLSLLLLAHSWLFGLQNGSPREEARKPTVSTMPLHEGLSAIEKLGKTFGDSYAGKVAIAIEYRALHQVIGASSIEFLRDGSVFLTDFAMIRLSDIDNKEISRLSTICRAPQVRCVFERPVRSFSDLLHNNKIITIDISAAKRSKREERLPKAPARALPMHVE